jgi:hypothetical protein
MISYPLLDFSGQLLQKLVITASYINASALFYTNIYDLTYSYTDIKENTLLEKKNTVNYCDIAVTHVMSINIKIAKSSFKNELLIFSHNRFVSYVPNSISLLEFFTATMPSASQAKKQNKLL